MFIFVAKIISANMKKKVYPNRIRVVLAEKTITNHWLAEQMGVTDMTMSRWTTNKIQPSTSQLINMAKILDVDIKDLLEPYEEAM